MKVYTNVSRKTVGEDRIAICPLFGCESIKRVKPLKLGFFGFGKYPKCEKHHVALVYIDERIGDFVDGALACLFDKAGLPPSDLLDCVKSKHPEELNLFVRGWVYCITVGRGAPIVSRYLDAISNAYLKQLTKKQVKALKIDDNLKKNSFYQSIRNGMSEITNQYTRLLKHHRVHSEVIDEYKYLKPFSTSLRNDLNDWQKNILDHNKIINSSENKNEMSLKETKLYYDQILNVGTCRCLLGLNPESKEVKKAKLTAFDRFSAYHEFYTEGLTTKFTKSDINDLCSESKLNIENFKPKDISKEENDFLMFYNKNYEDNSCNSIIYEKDDFDLEDGSNSEDIEKIKHFLKNVNWRQISDNWIIQVKGHGKIALNPYKLCSKKNPLYMHKKWLEWVYTNEDLRLSDRTIAKISGLKNHKSIRYWRGKFNIQTREEIGCYIIPGGYIDLYMPKEYKHPELNPFGNKRITRREHIVKMEEHLMNSLTPRELVLHPCLVGDDDGSFYIKNGCVVHHINYRKQDNYIENLWLYKSHSEHNNNNINTCLSGLIKLGQILFSKCDNQYYLENQFDYRKLKREQVKEIIKPVEFFRYENIDMVREEIKKMDWSDMKWTVDVQINKISTRRIHLNPYNDCSEENPLYRHKGWVESIIVDSRFNLTDPRLAELCRISVNTAYRWRGKIHRIPVESWGFKRYLHTLKNRTQIWIKFSKNYGNPFAIKKVGFNYMLEHRYLLERELARQPQKYHKYLVNGKYLKPECRVQHINLESLDNRIQNLHPCKNHSEHEKIHSSLFNLIDALLKKKFMIFKDGIYLLNY